VISRSELKALQAHREYPSVSILAPTHRTAPANKRDPIKVKNLLTTAVKRLHEEYTKREVADVVDRLQKLVKAVDWQHTLDGLALFAGRNVSLSVSLPFKVKPRAIVDETFATRDLAYALNRAVAYRVLVLGHQARLFDAWTTVLEEHSAKPFPMRHTGPGGAAKLPGGPGINPLAVRDDGMRQFFRSVDQAVAAVQRDNRLSLIVVGVDRNLAFFKEVTSHNADVVGMLTGNHEKTPPDKLGKLVWPIFDLAMTARRTEALVQLDSAVGVQRHNSGIDQVWRVANQGQVKMLLVEKNYKHPADLNGAGDRLMPYTGKGPAALDDAVDEVIERVMESGGDVYFYADGELDVHQRIAAVLRR
jgi:hypothetical protein